MIPDKYILNSVAHESCFIKLEQSVLSKGVASKHPVAIIVGAQPGAGKTNLIKFLRQRLRERHIVINGDDYRRMHPLFYSLSFEDDKKIAEYTDPSVRDWTSRLLSLAIDKSFNIILEITLRQHEPILATVERLSSRNYQIGLGVLAVKYEFSTLGIHERYETQKEALGYGRWTTQEAHDASYNNMPQTISFLENSRFLSAISVYDRNCSKIYGNHCDSCGNWTNQRISAYQAINDFRNRPLSREETELLFLSFDGLIAKKKQRDAPKDEIEIVQRMYDRFRGKHQPSPPSFRP
ncbi:MAG: zeta toxin family protein [Deltaproteobacteria bacterium]|jgi:hypothetical protein|nr:zeta toxin family protein [Deltaproteobacteria bacterium]